MMNNGIAVAGNMIADRIYTIASYPRPGELATIAGDYTRSTGGCACNVSIDLARMDEELPITVLGVVGDDGEGQMIKNAFAAYRNIRTDMLATEGQTSFTDVMNDQSANQRTFFHFPGANARFSRKHINLDELTADILHIGYILLLAEFDMPDPVYGTKLARLLAEAQQKGIKTSIDLVSDAAGRFQAIVPPALRYTDYCVINEWEAEQTTGVQLRSENGRIDNAAQVLKELVKMGVSEWAVIHAPEACYGYDCRTETEISMKTQDLPEGFIKGTTGAGDAFCAGVLYGAYKGKSLMEAMQMGIASATSSLTESCATDGVVKIGDMMKKVYG
jgi:sugar/nucleoside kinase (ribokinase family)